MVLSRDTQVSEEGAYAISTTIKELTSLQHLSLEFG